MRKLLAITAIIGVIITAAYLTACNGNKKEKETGDTDAAKDSIANVLKRGEYLVQHVSMCLDCHSQRDFTKYTGPVIPGTEGMGGEVFDQKHLGVPGTVYARNITSDPENGIGAWTDDEVLRAVTQGISKKGDTLFPIMPYATFNHMAKDDLLAIIAYIRTLKANKNKVPARELMVPIGMVYPAQALQPSVDGNVRPPESDQLKYGEYLTNMALCSDCHTPMTKEGAPDFAKMYAGGFLFNMETFKVNSANLTPDSTTGLGTWNEERFMNKFLPMREEKNYNMDPGKQNTMMPITAYAGMKDSDLKAIYAYLHNVVKPVKNLVEKYPK